MVKLRIVCPCGERNPPGKGRPIPPQLRRQSSLTPQAQSNLARYFSIAFIVFAATTYLVFSLDMLMVPEDEPVTLVAQQPRRRMEHVSGSDAEEDVSGFYLRSNADKMMTNGRSSIESSSSSSSSMSKATGAEGDGLVVLEEEDLEALTVERQRAQTDMSVQKRASSAAANDGEDDGFADGLNSIGLAMLDEQQQQTPRTNYNEKIAETDARKTSPQVVRDNPIVIATEVATTTTAASGDEGMISATEVEEEPPQPLEEEEEEDDDEDVAGRTTFPSKPIATSGPIVIASSSDWRRIHTCKYGRIEKSPTISYATWVWRHKKGAAMHDDYVKTPSDSKLRHLKAALHMVSDGVMDVKSVVSAASEAGYTLCKIDLETSMIIAWQPRLRGDALFFTRHAVSQETAADWVRNVVVEVPHALFDHTLHQGLHVFTETRARALVLSESHRCSKSLMNKCTGNEGEPIRNLCSSATSPQRLSYHNSDVAHAVQTTFHAVHEQLVEDNPTALVASLHATKSDDFVVSDGTSNPVTATAPIALFSKKLAANLPQTSVNLCNSLDFSSDSSSSLSNLVPVTEDKRHICGATNVQGRHMNGAADPCRAKVHRGGEELQATGRFLHIEQPVQMVVPIDTKSTKPVMSKPLSEAILAALEGV